MPILKCRVLFEHREIDIQDLEYLVVRTKGIEFNLRGNLAKASTL
jgi:hypothetical protein